MATDTAGRIRVACVVRPAQGGIRRHVHTLLAALQNDIAPTLFAPAEFCADPLFASFPCVAIPIAPRLSPKADVAVSRQLAKEFCQNFDIMHAHGLRAALLAVPAARSMGIPALFTAHNLPGSLRPLERFFLREIARRSAAIIAVSEAVKIALTKNGVPERKIVVIPNGVRLSVGERGSDFPQAETLLRRNKFLALENAMSACADNIKGDGFVREDGHRVFTNGEFIPPQKVLVAAGRLSHEKGFDILLEAMRLLEKQHEQIVLVLAGNGPERETLKKSAPSNVRFLGFVDNVDDLFSMADVVVVPSRQEGQGLTALEAMAAGVPVIASAVGGLMESVLEGSTGLLVPPENPSALADAIQRLLADATLRRTMGQAGRERVEARYSVATMKEQTLALYRRVIGGE